jgi:REP element-mobilizing transposase RayT
MIWYKCEEIGCDPIMINGMEDHVHILLHANPQLDISKMLKDIKGSSSRWLNENHKFLDSFSWQRGYGLFTVSPKDVKMIARYIQNQKEHHKAGSVNVDFEI